MNSKKKYILLEDEDPEFEAALRKLPIVDILPADWDCPEDDEYWDAYIDKKYMADMANIRGRYIKIEDIDFSFSFSVKNPKHKIRVRIRWDREKLEKHFDGYMELHGDYKYTPNKNSKKVSQYKIDSARSFFQKYKLLFAAVWEMKLDENLLLEYFRGGFSLHEIIEQFENISNEDLDLMLKCSTLTELDKCVRENKIFDVND